MGSSVMRLKVATIVSGFAAFFLVAAAIIAQFWLAGVKSPYGQIWIEDRGVEISHGLDSGGWYTPTFRTENWSLSELLKPPFLGAVENDRSIPVAELHMPWWLLVSCSVALFGAMLMRMKCRNRKVTGFPIRPVK
jgi:hypothetical protein